MKKFAIPGTAVIVAGLIGFGGLLGFGISHKVYSDKIEQLERNLRLSPTIHADIRPHIGLRPYKAEGKVIEWDGKEHIGFEYDIGSRHKIAEEHLYFDGKKFDNTVVLENMRYCPYPENWSHGVWGESTFKGFFDYKIKPEDLEKGKTYILKYEVIDEKGNKAEDIAVIKVK